MRTKKSQQGASRAKKSAVRRKRQRKRTVPVRPVPASGGIQLGHLSTCSETYLRVLSNPFTSISNACIPDTVTLPSTKHVFTSRGVFNSGTLGFGAIGVNPWSMIQQQATATVQGVAAPVVRTLATYAANTIPMAVTSATANVALSTSNSPYTIAQVVDGTGVEFRLVGCGLRVRYTGTELNRSGRVTFWRPRQNAPINGFLVGVDAVLNDNYYHTTPVDRTWREITYLPVRAADVTYSSYLDPTLAPFTDYRVLWCCLDGTVAGSSFEYEVKAYFEMVGQQVGGGLLQPTKSHADPVGFGAIMSSLPTTLQAAGSSMYASMKQGAIRALEYATSGVITMGARAIGTAMLGPAGGMLGGAAAGMLTGPTITDADD